VALVRERTIPTERPPPVGEGCHVVSATGSPRPLISVFQIRNRYFFFIQVAPQLTSRGSRGWVDPVPDPLLLRKSGSDGNRTRDLCSCSQKLWPLDHRGGLCGVTGHVMYHNLILHGYLHSVRLSDKTFIYLHCMIWYSRCKIFTYSHKSYIKLLTAIFGSLSDTF
jgi:hypothetical protein